MKESEFGFEGGGLFLGNLSKIYMPFKKQTHYEGK